MRYASGNSENLLMNNYHRLTLVLAIALALGLAPSAFGATAVKQKTFASAEEGVKALMEAAKKNDTNAMLAILGPKPSPSSNRAIKFPIVRLASASSNLLIVKQPCQIRPKQSDSRSRKRRMVVSHTASQRECGLALRHR
jgi:hypothetical protein